MPTHQYFLAAKPYSLPATGADKNATTLTCLYEEWTDHIDYVASHPTELHIRFKNSFVPQRFSAMPCYIITYDLDEPGQDYDDLFELIKSYRTWNHAMDSTWFIVTEEDAETIRNYLLSAVDGNDKLFVGRLCGEAAWNGLGRRKDDWLQKFV